MTTTVPESDAAQTATEPAARGDGQAEAIGGTLDRAAPATRTVPPHGIRGAYVRLELRRLLRNGKTLFFALGMPILFFFIFGTPSAYRTISAGRGNVTASILVSMALYGAMVTTTAGGASVSVERAQGWTRQLRLTPLRSWAYLATKVSAAMTLGAISVALTLAIGSFAGAQMPWWCWLTTGLIAWAGSIVFAAFGLFFGYLLPAENAMQILGPLLALLGFAGGLFVPLGTGWFATVAKFIPTYGLAELTRAPMTGQFDWTSVANVVIWGGLFCAGVIWRFRADSTRG